ncbi:MAG: fibronectin type III domain-containing protein [Gemmatimonadetes bacterium]|nr:fibronectin type III domain-containing protein [Gemmatimonadota bacterium]
MMTPSRRLLAVATLTGALAIGACGSDDGGGNGPSAPATPTGLAVAQLSLTSARITWTASTGATGYVLERADASNPGVFAAIGGTIANPTYDDAGLTAGVAYSYRVAATNGSDTSAFSSAVGFTSGLKAATLTGNIAASRTLYKDTVYTLSGYVKVQPGATLTIQAGTKLIGDSTVAGSSLWILRGAQINATGTSAEPIVFTSAHSAGNRKPGDWGGLIIIGNGIINRTGATINTEGGAAGVAENYAGGNDNNDNSGTLKYVRIEFAGFDISNGAGQELNALSSYAVGRGTTYEYIQTMAGLDDSFEFWGGAVDGRYLISYESGDDHFDWSEGYVGRNQFLIAFQSQRLVPRPGAGVFSSDPRGFEGDGCDPAVSGCTLTSTGASTPYSNPVFANFTMIGPGNLAGIPADGNGGVWRRGTGGVFANGILARWKGIAINVRDAWTDTLLVQRDSLQLAGLVLTQNGFNYDTTGAGFGQVTNIPASQVASHKAFAASVATDTLLGISLNPAGLDWTPKAGSPATSGGVTVTAGKVAGYFGGSFANTTYLGAADPSGTKWWQGWTAYTIN